MTELRPGNSDRVPGPPDASARPVLELAIAAERESLRSYIRWAFLTRAPAGKDTFIRLAADEFEHMTLLERELARRPPGCDAPSVPFGDAEVPPAGELEQVAARLRQAGPRTPDAKGLDDLEALLSALESEQRAERYYAEHAAGPAATTFRRLAEMEHAHAALIQAEIDHIQSTGFWFDIREFSLEGQ